MNNARATPVGRWRRFVSERVIAIAFYLCVGGIAGVGFLAYHLIGRTAQSEAWVLHTLLVVARIEGFHQSLMEAESTGRAFIITGDPSFRETYTTLLSVIDSELYDLKARMAHDKAQQDLTRELEASVGRRFAWLTAQMALRARDGFEAVQAASIGAGAEEMRRITSTIERMKEAENRLLSERTDVLHRHNRLVEAGLAGLLLAAILTSSALFGYMSRLWKMQQSAEATALHLAHHDSLTGLPNRRLLQDRIAVGIDRAKRYGERLAVLCLDLDGFKSVNDRHGHDAGDGLLKAVADRLTASVRAADTVARLGGDEFVVLLQVKEALDADLIAGKIIEQVSRPFRVGLLELSVGTSVGIALFPAHGASGENLLKQADLALYQAKSRGKGCYVRAAADAMELEPAA
jgi:diguanylate cyclase (GGDEF)-like protein